MLAILEKSHPSSDEVFYAVNVICGDQVADYAKTVQIYLANGLDPVILQRHYDLNAIKQQLDRLSLNEYLYQLISHKIDGIEVSVNDGIDRSVGFLTKILNSSGQLNLFDLNDACEMIKLSLELLSGRRFYYFKAITNFENIKQDKLFRQMEYLRQNMRLKQWQAHGLIEQIYDTLSQPTPDLDIRPLIDVTHDLDDNFTQMYHAIEMLDMRLYSLDKKRQIEQLKHLFRSVRDAIKRDLDRYHYALKYWNANGFCARDMFEEAVQVKMDFVELVEYQRYAFAEKLQNFYQHHSLYDGDTIKRYAIFIVKQLSLFTELENPSIACAIEVSQGANLSSVGYNYSTQLKVEMTYNLSQSVYANIRTLKKRYRNALVSQYQA